LSGVCTGAGHPVVFHPYACLWRNASCAMPFSIGRSTWAVDGAKDGEREARSWGDIFWAATGGMFEAAYGGSNWREVELEAVHLLIWMSTSDKIQLYGSEHGREPPCLGVNYHVPAWITVSRRDCMPNVNVSDRDHDRWCKIPAAQPKFRFSIVRKRSSPFRPRNDHMNNIRLQPNSFSRLQPNSFRLQPFILQPRKIACDAWNRYENPTYSGLARNA